MLYRFGLFILRESTCALERDGSPRPLRRQAFAVLRYLLAHRERVVSKQELFREVWPQTRVTDNALAQCLVDIRRALGDDGAGRRMIRTCRGVGFQFNAEVTVEQEGLAGVERRLLPLPSRAAPLILLLPFSIASGEQLEAELASEIELELLRQLVDKSPVPVAYLHSKCPAPAMRPAENELGAAFVVEGRVQRLEERVRLRLLITETATSTAIWAERYDIRISRLFDDEDAVTCKAAEALLRAANRLMARPEPTRFAFNQSLSTPDALAVNVAM
jgi:DNA-binding winged helix-turn-helix (wHTH) protein